MLRPTLQGNADAPPEVHRARKSTLLRLRNLVYRNYGDGYTVELFGSTRYGVSSANSDLDLVLIVRLPCLYIFHPLIDLFRTQEDLMALHLRSGRTRVVCSSIYRQMQDVIVICSFRCIRHKVSLVVDSLE